jgi:hypothetical protein
MQESGDRRRKLLLSPVASSATLRARAVPRLLTRPVMGIGEVGMDEMAMAPRPPTLDAASWLDGDGHDAAVGAGLVERTGAK